MGAALETVVKSFLQKLMYSFRGNIFLYKGEWEGEDEGREEYERKDT